MIEINGKRIRVAANEPPKMTMHGVHVEEHPEVAAHQHERDEHGGPGEQAKASGNIHN